MVENYISKIKNYTSKEQADEDNNKMDEEGYRWFSGWYTIKGYVVEYRNYNSK